MRLTVIVTQDDRVAGATAGPALPENRIGYPSAQLVAGPGQRLVEIDVPDEVVPRPESDPAQIERFLADLATRVQGNRSH
jgi:hypothetical protein